MLRFATLRVAYAITSAAAGLKYIFSKRDRELVKANLRAVFPNASKKEIALLAREVFKNFGKYLVDFFSLIKNRQGYLEATVQFRGLENLKEALKLGRGCVLLSGHFGNWELAACALANLGFKVSAVTLAHSDPRINNLFIKERTRGGVGVIPIGTAKIGCQKVLHKGENVAILGDRPYGDHGIEIKLFNKQALFPRGAALFCIKNGSPLVILFSYKEDTSTNKYTLVFDEPIFAENKRHLGEQLKELTQTFTHRFEYYIKKYPSQWYMFNKVWKD
jgi:KDO2-lipid IV(A) lauroyltransferase